MSLSAVLEIIHVFMYSYIEAAVIERVENTASVTRASVCVVNKTLFIQPDMHNMQDSYLNSIMWLNIHRH